MRLVAVGITPAMVDAAEDGGRIGRLHEGAGAEIDGLTGNRHVVGIHHAMDEADVHPLRDQPGLALGHRAQQTQHPVGRADQGRVVARDGVLGQLAQFVEVTAGDEVLEGPHAKMTRRHPREHRAGQRQFARHRLAGSGDRQRAGGGNAQRMHRLADDHLAQHRPHRGTAVTAARKRCAARPLQREVAAPAVAVDHLAQQERAAVAQLRREAAELVAGIGLRQRLGTIGHAVAGKHRREFGRRQRFRRQAQFGRELGIEVKQAWRGHRGGLPRDVEAGQFARVGVVESEAQRGICGCHGQ